jgi:hypothetical protein
MRYNIYRTRERETTKQKQKIKKRKRLLFMVKVKMFSNEGITREKVFFSFAKAEIFFDDLKRYNAGVNHAQLLYDGAIVFDF